MENNLKQRNGCISLWLWIAFLANISLALFYIIYAFEWHATLTIVGYGLYSILSIVNVLATILLMRWLKKGFSLFVMSSLIGCAVSFTILPIPLVFIITSLFSIFFWWLILQAKKDGISAWSQLAEGWDYKHCRHLYQMFVTIILLLIGVTLIAVGMRGEEFCIGDDMDSDTLISQVEVYPEEEIVDSLFVVEEQEEPIIDESPVPEPIIKDRREKETQPDITPAPESPAPPKKPARSDDDSSTQTSAEQLLDMGLKQANNEFPQNVGGGIVMTRVYLSGNYVMYVAECDEDLLDMDLMEQNKSMMLVEMKKALGGNDPNIRMFMNICAKAGKGVGYTYVGDTTGKKVVVRITNSELKALL